MGRKSSQISIPEIENRIFTVRNDKVMLDSDLAELYGVTTKRLNQQVNRNLERFPRDFMFRLSIEEYKNLRLQIATSSLEHGGRRKLPYVFTEHGGSPTACCGEQQFSVPDKIPTNFPQNTRRLLLMKESINMSTSKKSRLKAGQSAQKSTGSFRFHHKIC